MKLFFLRHGEANWPNWNRPDDERPLTRRGEAEMQRVAIFLERSDVLPDLIVTSPLPRAAQTAQIVADCLKIPLQQNAALAPGCDHKKLKTLQCAVHHESLMVVGHAPDFSQIIRVLTGATIKMSKAGLALVELDAGEASGRLLWLIPPKLAKTATA